MSLGDRLGEGAATYVPADLRSLLLELSRAIADGVETEGDGWDRVFSGRDEDSLVHSGFKPTSTRHGWTRADKHGQWWSVYAMFDGGQGGMVWYKLNSDGISVRHGTIMFSEYKRLFDTPHTKGN